MSQETTKLNNGNGLRLGDVYLPKVRDEVAPSSGLSTDAIQIVHTWYKPAAIEAEKPSTPSKATYDLHSIVAELKLAFAEAVADIKTSIDTMRVTKEKSSTEDGTGTTYAVRFAPHAEGNGLDVLLRHTDNFVGLRDGILIADASDVEHLKAAGIDFEAYTVQSNDVDDIYKHFGLRSEAEWLEQTRPRSFLGNLLSYFVGRRSR